jgi:hypothetical protein
MNESNEHRDHKLSSVYREGAWPEPGRQIDQAILAASRRAWRERPFFKRWAPAFAVAATVLLTSSLALKVYLAQPDTVSPSGPDKSPERGATQAPASEEVKPPQVKAEAPAPKPVTTPPGFSSTMDSGEASRVDRMQRDLSAMKLSTPPSESPVPAPRSALAEKAGPALKKEASAAQQRQPAPPAPQPAPVSVFGAAPPDAAPAAAGQQAPRSAPAGKPQQIFTQSAPARAEPQAQGAQPAQAAALSASTSAASGNAAAAGERSPQTWIDDIHKLMNEGKSEEAGEELAKFKKRYPDYALPADLR